MNYVVAAGNAILSRLKPESVITWVPEDFKSSCDLF